MSQISIILPTYNVEKYIARALETCINQTFKDIEIIVVDDCGDDKSIDIAKEYASKDDRIKIIYNEENLGTFASRNIGVLNSSSPYIMFLDPDDYLELNACELGFEKIKNVDVVVFNYKIEQENNTFINTNIKFNKPLIKIDIFLLHYCIHSTKHELIHSMFNKIYKKNLYINSISNYISAKKRILMGEDVFTNFLYLLNSKSIYIENQILYCYCYNPNSATKENTNKNKILNFIEDLTFIISQLKILLRSSKKEFKIALKIAIYNLSIHKIDLTYKYTNKNFFEKIFLKIQRKKIKIKKNIQIKNAKNILKEANVSHCF
ncbi:glycosyltransferase family 2 protein [Campylobacter sp. IFREMER_LSEM_CL2151]|uniref:glycosyltransferase family 2 protein n=1 Tax=Campylobacter sp. IFREMER_LSEM_CL2151 TaxID=2911620 RepID=UPI0021E70EF3|nr:glycosyltransferase family 2 protein [Campylobacter sp. IFREMER_LSEM_CL2151]MCV3375240.1 glycosyltransferase [Campylobacter sp. IFREMER_LSEM_CL2151]